MINVEKNINVEHYEIVEHNVEHYENIMKKTLMRLMWKKTSLLIQEQQPEINVDNFSTPLYLFNT